MKPGSVTVTCPDCGEHIDVELTLKQGANSDGVLHVNVGMADRSPIQKHAETCTGR